MASWKISAILSQVKLYLALFGAPMITIETTRVLGGIMLAASAAITAFQKKLEEQGIEDYSGKRK